MNVQMTELMRLPDGAEQRPGFVVPNGANVLTCVQNVSYCPAPPLPAARLRQWLRDAGVHIYCDTDDPIMVGGGYIAIHAASDGAKTIINPTPARWDDVRTGQVLASAARSITVNMSLGETRNFSVTDSGER